MKLPKRRRQSAVVAVFMFALFAAVILSVWIRAKRMEKIPYLDHLDDVAVTIDGTEYLFRDMAFYLAYQERMTEEQAKAYDLKNPSRYWNLHTNGSFIRLEARDAAMDMLVHDVLFYQMAMERGLSLSSEEMEYMENQEADFWSDLEEEGQERIGVSREEISRAFDRMGLAQKAQQIFADEAGVDFREYNMNGSLYQKLMQEHEYKVNEALWERLNFGNITIH